MRTSMFLLAGILLLSAAMILGRLFANNFPAATAVATAAFVVVWLAIAGANMWVDVARAGYSAAEELPIFLLIFGVPAIAAVILKWKFMS
ncbi:MAG TPA: hypothetical protein VJ820_11425 [Propionibacteriaceae bacterium]|nr:hypothetical protein [Propionibacteriaceae bacterium]